MNTPPPRTAPYQHIIASTHQHTAVPWCDRLATLPPGAWPTLLRRIYSPRCLQHAACGWLPVKQERIVSPRPEARADTTPRQHPPIGLATAHGTGPTPSTSRTCPVGYVSSPVYVYGGSTGSICPPDRSTAPSGCVRAGGGLLCLPSSSDRRQMVLHGYHTPVPSVELQHPSRWNIAWAAGDVHGERRSDERDRLTGDRLSENSTSYTAVVSPVRSVES